MKQKFSTSWVSSRQVRKQRKYRHNTPLHLKHRFLSALLSKELRKKHGKRNTPIRKGDEVLIMRGNFAKKKGKIVEVNLRKEKVTIEGISRSKLDGTKVNVLFNASNLQIISLNLEDRKRMKNLKEKTAKEDKKEDAPNKSQSK